MNRRSELSAEQLEVKSNAYYVSAEELEVGAADLFEEFLKIYCSHIYNVRSARTEKNEMIVTSKLGNTYRFSVVLDDKFSWERANGEIEMGNS